MLPVDLGSIVKAEIASSRRPDDGLLHASSDLVGSLRHTQLRLAGAPRDETIDIASSMAMENGTMWHRRLFSRLVDEGIMVMQEVKLNAWMPTGWSGTADLLFWDWDKEGFVLGDLKTTRGEALRWIEREGAKTEHMWQASAYWHALWDSGLPMVNGFSIFYLPTSSAGEETLPIEAECSPLSREAVYGEMEQRWELTQRYLATTREGLLPKQAVTLYGMGEGHLEYVVNENLAPIMQREQKLTWNKTTNVFDLKLYPHWSAQYCPYDDELCACSSEGITKIGHYKLDKEYVPYKDSEIEPVVSPSEKDYRSKEVTIVSI